MFDVGTFLDQTSQKGNYAIELPEFFNFGFDIVDGRAAERDKTAFIAVDGSGTRVDHYSFSRLRRASNRVANALGQLGVGRGEFALIMLPRIPQWYEVMIGCIKAGVVCMPGTPLLTAKDIEYRLARSGASAAIVSAAHAEKVEMAREHCPALRHLLLVGAERDGWSAFDRACADASELLNAEEVGRSRGDDLMMLYFTSGTTSAPKMVPTRHDYALAHAITGAYWMDLREDDIHWTLSDTGWAKAAWGMLFPPWLFGAASVLYDGAAKFDAEAHLTLIAQLAVTTFCAPPTVYRMFAQMDLTGYDLSSLRHSLSAGEPLNPEAMRAWCDATGNMIYDGYGQTETVNVVANVPGMEIRPGSMGKPTPGFDVQIVDEDGVVCEDDAVGHIAIRLTRPPPPGLFDGYYEGPGARNREAFRHGWYYTGDMGRRDADGYIWFAGRADDIITSAGYRISPFEVESVLLEHEAVAESAVVAKPDALRGEIVKAFIVLAAGYAPSDALEQDIQDFVKATTAPYKYPREIEFRDSLPKTISGKIRRVELRARS